MALHAFIADISPPEQRGFRIAMVQLAMSLPRPISPLIGAVLYEKGKWCVFICCDFIFYNLNCCNYTSEI